MEAMFEIIRLHGAGVNAKAKAKAKALEMMDRSFGRVWEDWKQPPRELTGV